MQPGGDCPVPPARCGAGYELESSSPRPGVAARIERFVRSHPRLIPRVQRVMIATYLALILVPPLLPDPGPTATPLTSFVRFAQFAIWSVWWPFVLLSLLVFGRAWCGVVCPEGALAQAASRFARRRPVPRLVTWGAVPLFSFLTITIVGQLLEVDERPLPQLLVLGGSTLAAVGVSLVFSRNTRVWCRYLCPVSMLFGVFSRLGAASFQVDRARLAAASPTANHKEPCPVLIHLPVMSTARDCQMCFGCAGWRDAIHLRVRRPGEEIERIDRAQPMFWEVMFLFGGAIGLPLGVFYAEARELEGARLVLSLVGGTLVAIALLSVVTALGARVLRERGNEGATWRDLFTRLGYAYAPISLFSLFLGLSKPTFETMEHAGLSPHAAAWIRTALLAVGALWGLASAVKIMRIGRPRPRGMAIGFALYAAGAAAVLGAWGRLVVWG